MAIIQRRVFKSVNIRMGTGLPMQLPTGIMGTDQGSAEALWGDQFFDDVAGQVLNDVPHRRAYTVDQKSDFLVDVPNAAAYVTILGW